MLLGAFIFVCRIYLRCLLFLRMDTVSAGVKQYPYAVIAREYYTQDTIEYLIDAKYLQAGEVMCFDTPQTTIKTEYFIQSYRVVDVTQESL